MHGESIIILPVNAYTSRSTLNGILAAAMLENGISQETLPNEMRFRRLMTFMKDYGTARMDGDRITGYRNKLDEAMKRFNVSLPDLVLATSTYSPIDINSFTYCHQGGLCGSKCTTDGSKTIDDESRFVRAQFCPLLSSSGF
jgi:hypothetical protein